MTVRAEVRTDEALGGAQLITNPFHLLLSPGEARAYEWNDGNPDACLIESDETGTHYVLRELIGAGACRFERIEARDPDPNLRVHAIITPDNQVIGTLVARLVHPEDVPARPVDRARQVARKALDWFFGDESLPELHFRVRPSRVQAEA